MISMSVCLATCCGLGQSALRGRSQGGRLQRPICRCQFQFGVDERGKGRLNTRCKSKTMKTKICLLGFFALVSLAIAAPHTWILTTGKTVTGDYFSSGTTTLVIKTDGTNCFIKFSDLSDNDQAYVAQMKASVENGRPVKPIDGLFGIKLGQSLPSSCTNSASYFSAPNEWGFQLVFHIEPPQTNSEFETDSYIVTLTPTNRLVCKIEAKRDSMGGFDTMRNLLQNIYGKENDFFQGYCDDKREIWMSWSTWSQNRRTLKLLENDYKSVHDLTLSCQDESLMWHPTHEPDSNGLK
jgi:hypothetical protein